MQHVPSCEHFGHARPALRVTQQIAMEPIVVADRNRACDGLRKHAIERGGPSSSLLVDFKRCDI